MAIANTTASAYGPFDLVIFDCDGVLVGSEIITNRVFRRCWGAGVCVTLDTVFARIIGPSLDTARCSPAECWGAISQRALPPSSGAAPRRRSPVVAVAGVEHALDGIGVPWCVASNGTRDT